MSHENDAGADDDPARARARAAARHGAHPPLRGALRRPLRPAEDPRLPAPVHRRGGGRGRRDPRARSPTTRSSPPIASTATRSSAASPPSAIMAEMYGKREGCSRGRGGSMHIFDAAAALLRRQRDRRRRPAARGRPRARRQDAGRGAASTAAFFGEGAVAEGAFHESMNLAALWELPVAFFCENNFYAMGTALARSESQTDLCAKAAALRRADARRSTAWTSSPCTRRRARPSTHVRARRRAVLRRVPDLPLSAPTRCSIRISIATRRRSRRGSSAARSTT